MSNGCLPLALLFHCDGIKGAFPASKNKSTDIRDITVRLPSCPIARYDTVTVNLGSSTILRLIDPQLAAA